MLAPKLMVALSPLVCDNDLQVIGNSTHAYVQRPGLLLRVGMNDDVGDRLADAELDAVELRIRDAEAPCDARDGVPQGPDRLRPCINLHAQHRSHVSGIPARRLIKPSRAASDLA